MHNSKVDEIYFTKKLLIQTRQGSNYIKYEKVIIINAVLTIYVNVRLSIILLNLDRIIATMIANTLLI